MPADPKITNWQPIETAPKDKPILAWVIFTEDQLVDGWRVICWGVAHGGKEGWLSDGWCILAPTGDPDDDRVPTHWMPLPEPPADQKTTLMPVVEKK